MLPIRTRIGSIFLCLGVDLVDDSLQVIPGGEHSLQVIVPGDFVFNGHVGIVSKILEFFKQGPEINLALTRVPRPSIPLQPMSRGYVLWRT